MNYLPSLLKQFFITNKFIGVCKRPCPNARIYQASSSEMFGNSIDKDGFQRLSTPMVPVSPYGCSK